MGNSATGKCEKGLKSHDEACTSSSECDTKKHLGACYGAGGWSDDGEPSGRCTCEHYHFDREWNDDTQDCEVKGCQDMRNIRGKNCQDRKDNGDCTSDNPKKLKQAKKFCSKTCE